jgi:hypothetical protein
MRRYEDARSFRLAPALAALAAACITLQAGSALASEELRPSLTSFDAELGVITASDLHMWLDGDLTSQPRDKTASYTNEAGNEVESRKRLNATTIRLVRRIPS